MKMNVERFEFAHNGDVSRDALYIGRIESDGRLALVDQHRDEAVAAEVFAALREQLHVCGDFEPPFGWTDSHYECESMRETNI